MSDELVHGILLVVVSVFFIYAVVIPVFRLWKSHRQKVKNRTPIAPLRSREGGESNAPEDLFSLRSASETIDDARPFAAAASAGEAISTAEPCIIQNCDPGPGYDTSPSYDSSSISSFDSSSSLGSCDASSGSSSSSDSSY